MEPSQASSSVVEGPWGRAGLAASEESIKLIPKIRPSTTPGLPDYVQYVGHKALSLAAPGAENALWDFDFVASPHTRQSSFFRVAGRPMADHFLAFYNAAVIAYGQTGSGKTHTMLGTLPLARGARGAAAAVLDDMPREAGLIPRILDYIFQRITAENLPGAAGTQQQPAGGGQQQAGSNGHTNNSNIPPAQPRQQQSPLLQAAAAVVAAARTPPPGQKTAAGGEGDGAGFATPVADGSRSRRRSGIPTPTGVPRTTCYTPPPASPVELGAAAVPGPAPAAGLGAGGRGGKAAAGGVAGGGLGSSGGGGSAPKYLVKASMLQIYQEVVTDLLNPRPVRLQLRESMQGGVTVVGLSEVTIRSAAEALHLLRVGTSHRAVAETASNPVSSRSHCILTLHVEARDCPEPGVVRIRRSRMQLVDLAGSERTSKVSDYASTRQKEANAINRSLSTLCLVINRLSDRTRSQGPVPYRDSKLTFLLQDCLGGNAKTLIIANLNPSPNCSSETNMTLGFALRAKRVRNRAFVNEDHQGDAVVLQGEVRRLREELSIFRTLHAEDAPPRGLQQLSAWRNQTAARASELHTALELNGQLETRLAVLEAAHSRLKTDYAALEEQCEAQRTEMSALEATVEQCEDELLQLRTRPTPEQHRELERQLAATALERDQVAAQHRDMAALHARLQADYEELAGVARQALIRNNSTGLGAHAASADDPAPAPPSPSSHWCDRDAAGERDQVSDQVPPHKGSREEEERPPAESEGEQDDTVDVVADRGAGRAGAPGPGSVRALSDALGGLQRGFAVEQARRFTALEEAHAALVAEHENVVQQLAAANATLAAYGTPVARAIAAAGVRDTRLHVYPQRDQRQFVGSPRPASGPGTLGAVMESPEGPEDVDHLLLLRGAAAALPGHSLSVSHSQRRSAAVGGSLCGPGSPSGQVRFASPDSGADSPGHATGGRLADSASWVSASRHPSSAPSPLPCPVYGAAASYYPRGRRYHSQAIEAASLVAAEAAVRWSANLPASPTEPLNSDRSYCSAPATYLLPTNDGGAAMAAAVAAATAAAGGAGAPGGYRRRRFTSDAVVDGVVPELSAGHLSYLRTAEGSPPMVGHGEASESRSLGTVVRVNPLFDCGGGRGAGRQRDGTDPRVSPDSVRTGASDDESSSGTSGVMGAITATTGAVAGALALRMQSGSSAGGRRWAADSLMCELPMPPDGGHLGTPLMQPPPSPPAVPSQLLPGGGLLDMDLPPHSAPLPSPAASLDAKQHQILLRNQPPQDQGTSGPGLRGSRADLIAAPGPGGQAAEAYPRAEDLVVVREEASDQEVEEEQFKVEVQQQQQRRRPAGGTDADKTPCSARPSAAARVSLVVVCDGSVSGGGAAVEDDASSSATKDEAKVATGSPATPRSRVAHTHVPHPHGDGVGGEGGRVAAGCDMDDDEGDGQQEAYGSVGGGSGVVPTGSSPLVRGCVRAAGSRRAARQGGAAPSASAADVVPNTAAKTTDPGDDKISPPRAAFQTFAGSYHAGDGAAVDAAGVGDALVCGRGTRMLTEALLAATGQPPYVTGISAPSPLTAGMMTARANVATLAAAVAASYGSASASASRYDGTPARPPVAPGTTASTAVNSTAAIILSAATTASATTIAGEECCPAPGTEGNSGGGRKAARHAAGASAERLLASLGASGVLVRSSASGLWPAKSAGRTVESEEEEGGEEGRAEWVRQLAENVAQLEDELARRLQNEAQLRRELQSAQADAQHAGDQMQTLLHLHSSMVDELAQRDERIRELQTFVARLYGDLKSIARHVMQDQVASAGEARPGAASRPASPADPKATPEDATAQEPGCNAKAAGAGPIAGTSAAPTDPQATARDATTATTTAAASSPDPAARLHFSPGACDTPREEPSPQSGSRRSTRSPGGGWGSETTPHYLTPTRGSAGAGSTEAEPGVWTFGSPSPSPSQPSPGSAWRLGGSWAGSPAAGSPGGGAAEAEGEARPPASTVLAAGLMRLVAALRDGLQDRVQHVARLEAQLAATRCRLEGIEQQLGPGDTPRERRQEEGPPGQSPADAGQSPEAATAVEMCGGEEEGTEGPQDGPEGGRTESARWPVRNAAEQGGGELGAREDQVEGRRGEEEEEEGADHIGSDSDDAFMGCPLSTRSYYPSPAPRSTSPFLNRYGANASPIPPHHPPAANSAVDAAAPQPLLGPSPAPAPPPAGPLALVPAPSFASTRDSVRDLREASLRAQLLTYERRVVELMERSEGLEAAVEAAVAERNARVAELQSQAAQLAASMQAQLASRDTQIAALQAQAGEMDAALRAASSEAARCRQQASEASVRAERCGAELRAIEYREQVLVGKLRQMEVMFTRRGEEVAALREDLAAAAAQLASMRAQAVAAQVEAAAARQSAAALQDTLDDLRATLGLRGAGPPPPHRTSLGRSGSFSGPTQQPPGPIGENTTTHPLSGMHPLQGPLASSFTGLQGGGVGGGGGAGLSYAAPVRLVGSTGGAPVEGRGHWGQVPAGGVNAAGAGVAASYPPVYGRESRSEGGVEEAHPLAYQLHPPGWPQPRMDGQREPATLPAHYIGGGGGGSAIAVAALAAAMASRPLGRTSRGGAHSHGGAGPSAGAGKGGHGGAHGRFGAGSRSVGGAAPVSSHPDHLAAGAAAPLNKGTWVQRFLCRKGVSVDGSPAAPPPAATATATTSLLPEPGAKWRAKGMTGMVLRQWGPSGGGAANGANLSARQAG